MSRGDNGGPPPVPQEQKPYCGFIVMKLTDGRVSLIPIPPPPKDEAEMDESRKNLISLVESVERAPMRDEIIGMCHSLRDLNVAEQVLGLMQMQATKIATPRPGGILKGRFGR